jgi:antitoxin HigA-1
MTRNVRNNMRPIHPAEHLREDILPALGRPKAEIARLLGISRQSLYDLLAEKQPVTVPMAFRLAKLVGGKPEIWLKMQMAYDVKMAETDLSAMIAKIPTLREAA